MKQLTNYIFILLLSFILGACGNKFLDESPKTAIGDNELISTITDLDNAANGCYHYLLATSGAYGYYYDSWYTFSGDLLGDDFRSEKSWSKDYYQYNATAYDITTVIYIHAYKLCNHVAMTIKGAEILAESQEKETLIAEMRVLRALAHFDLAKLWSPLPSNLGKGTISADALGVKIYDEIPKDIRESAYRDKAKDVYAFINKELNDWVPKLSKKKRNGRLDYYGGLALRARFNLYMENWDGALNDALEIMKSGKYSLYNMDEYVSVWEKEFTSESIFELRVTETEPNQWVSIGTIAGNLYHIIGTTKDFEKLMKTDPNDVRFDVYVYSKTEQYYTPKLKYVGRDGNEKVCSPKLFRLSEMYLIAAEAAMRLGKTDAGKYLSDLREKRTTTTPRKYDAGITLDDVLYERRIELACEGHRAWDLWRNLKPVVRWTTSEEKLEKRHMDIYGVIPFDHFHRVWPIPDRELQLLPESERAGQQNPGY
ncbi:MAG: RagB/SusD family nutrient uptake outer membrane protein [Bacteroidales bacterium]